MYLAIEGVIGVGKTSLARLLQPTYNAELMLEVFEENPFLSDFYGDRARYALQTQLFFLLSRYRQQREAPARLAASGALIADYTFSKDALFARINIAGDELELYRRLHDALAEKITRPDLLVYLRASTDELMRRIAKRGRVYEQNMEREYIRQLGEAYDEFFAAYKESPTLIIDADPLDYVARPEDLQRIIEQIHGALGLEYQASLPLGQINPASPDAR